MANSETPISPVGNKAPELVITQASINNEPVELDGTPMSPDEQDKVHSKGQNEQLSPQDQQHRQDLISARKIDPAVLVDIPQTPQAEELATARKLDTKIQ